MPIPIQRSFTRRSLIWACALLVALTHLATLRLTFNRWICVDEFEHLHAAWCITPAGGSQVPYRDFFEHHTPLLYYVLAPLLALIRPEVSYDRAWLAVIACRLLMWLLAATVLYLIYRLGKRQHSRITGALAAVLSLCSMKFIDRTLEIRPDLLSVPCILAALALSLRAVQGAKLGVCPRVQNPNSGAKPLFFSGVLFGLAVLATPKTLFALLGYTPAILGFFFQLAAAGGPKWWHLPSFKTALRLGLLHLAGFLLPIALTLAFLATQHAAWDFYHHNFLLNARWHFQLDKWQMVGEVIFENPLTCALGLSGLAATLVGSICDRTRQRGHLLLAATAVGLIAGIFIIPVPYDEYFLMLIPLLAIFAARTLVHASRAIISASHNRWGKPGTLETALAAVAITIILLNYRPPMLAYTSQTVLWGVAAAGVVAAMFLRARFLVVASVLMGTLGYALPRYVSLFELSNESWMRRMAYVHAHTSPADTVMDGWDKISAPFRPHAWRYFFLHREIRPMLTSAEWAELRLAMESGTFRPALIVFDVDNQSLPDPIVAWIRAHYEPISSRDIGLPTAEAPIWRRRSSTTPPSATSALP